MRYTIVQFLKTVLLFFTDDVDLTEDDYVRYTLSIHSSQPLFIDEVNAMKFEQLRYAPADALITLAKQSKTEEHSDSRDTSIRISQVIFLGYLPMSSIQNINLLN